VLFTEHAIPRISRISMHSGSREELAGNRHCSHLAGLPKV